MGLSEKRAITAFQETKFPALKKEIDAAAGFVVPMEVKWDTLASEGYGSDYETFFTKVFFQPVINAFQAVCTDQMGKDALKNNLKKIMISNEGGFYSPEKAISFKNGVLSIDHQPHSNVDDVKDRTNFLQKTLENSL